MLKVKLVLFFGKLIWLCLVCLFFDLSAYLVVYIVAAYFFSESLGDQHTIFFDAIKDQEKNF